MLECCVYCTLPIGSIILFPTGEQVILKKQLDHFFPKSKGGADDDSSLVVSCHLCNSIKSAKVFDSVESVRAFVQYAHSKSGFTVIFNQIGVHEKVSSKKEKSIQVPLVQSTPLNFAEDGTILFRQLSSEGLPEANKRRTKIIYENNLCTHLCPHGRSNAKATCLVCGCKFNRYPKIELC